MSTRLSRWGHSIGLRVPRHVLECAGLRAGDEVFIRALESGDVLVRAVKPREPPGGSVTGAVVEKTDEQILAEW